MTYIEWYQEQSSERREQSDLLMELSRELGKESIHAPFSDRAEELRAAIRSLYLALQENTN